MPARIPRAIRNRIAAVILAAHLVGIHHPYPHICPVQQLNGFLAELLADLRYRWHEHTFVGPDRVLQRDCAGLLDVWEENAFPELVRERDQ